MLSTFAIAFACVFASVLLAYVSVCLRLFAFARTFACASLCCTPLCLTLNSENSLCPQNFWPAILGPKMAAPNLMGAWKIALFLQKNLHAGKIPRFSGGIFGLWVGSAGFIFVGARILLVDWAAASPKDPPVLKRLWRVNSARGPKFTTTIANWYGECSEMLVFLGKRGRETVEIMKNYGGSKTLRIRAP